MIKRKVHLSGDICYCVCGVRHPDSPITEIYKEVTCKRCQKTIEKYMRYTAPNRFERMGL